MKKALSFALAVQDMIHEMTRSEITRSNTNKISYQFVSLVRVDSWIDLFTQKNLLKKTRVYGLLHRMLLRSVYARN